MMSRGLCYSLQALHISWNRRLLWINQNISILNVKPQSLSITIFDNCKTKCLEPKSLELLTTDDQYSICGIATFWYKVLLTHWGSIILTN